MLKFILILIVLFLLGWKFLLVTLLFKYINLIKKLIENQLTLHEDLLQIRIDLVKIKSKKVLKEFEDTSINKMTQENNKTFDPKSSFISNTDLAKLMEGKDLLFQKQVHVSQGEVFTDRDIDI